MQSAKTRGPKENIRKPYNIIFNQKGSARVRRGLDAGQTRVRRGYRRGYKRRLDEGRHIRNITDWGQPAHSVSI